MTRRTFSQSASRQHSKASKKLSESQTIGPEAFDKFIEEMLEKDRPEKDPNEEAVICHVY